MAALTETGKAFIDGFINRCHIVNKNMKDRKILSVERIINDIDLAELSATGEYKKYWPVSETYSLPLVLQKGIDFE